MFKKMSLIVVSFFVLMGLVIPPTVIRAAGDTYYVATNGLNTNPGTLALPFKTIQKAANVAVAGDTVFIRGGTYYETVTFPNSGTSTNPIVFKNYNGESVTVSAADKVTGWTLHSGNIYKATVTWDMGQGMNLLLVDNTMMVEARYPNITDETGIISVLVNKSATMFQSSAYIDKVTSSAIKATDNWAGATYWGHHGLGWAAQTARVTSSAAGVLNVTDTNQLWGDRLVNGVQRKGGWWCYGCIYPDDTGTWDGGAGYGFLTGVYAALDTPREYFFDTANNTVYFWAPGGVNPNTLNVYAKRRVSLFVLAGKSYITIDGLNGLGGGIDMDGSVGCTIKNGSYKALSHFFKFTDGRADNILGTTYDDPAASGIYVSGSNNTFENLNLAYSAGAMIRMDGMSQTVKNTVITDGGYAGTYAGGIFIDYHDSTAATRGGHLITRNTITRSGRGAVAWNSKATFSANVDTGILDTANYVYYKGSTITHNILSEFLMTADDGGAVYSWGADVGSDKHTEVAWNWVSGARSTGSDRGKTAGIYFDNFSSHVTIHHNVLWDISGQGVKVYTKSQDIWIYNNTLDTTEPAVGQWVPNEGVRIINNLATNVTYHYQTPRDVFLTNIGQGTGLKFVGSPNAPRTGLYYRLQSTSPALNVGTLITNIVPGKTMQMVTIGLPDLGAYESGLTAWDAGAGSSIPGYQTLPEAGEPTWTPSPSPTATNTPAPLPGGVQLEVEDADAMNGVTVSTSGSTTYIGGYDTGDYVMFQMNLGAGWNTLRMNYAHPGASGTSVEVRLDSPTGTKVCTMPISDTGSWTTFAQFTTSCSGASGVHNVYFVGVGGSGVANIDWVKFENPGSGPTNTPVAPSATATKTNTPGGPTATPSNTPTPTNTSAPVATIRLEAESYNAMSGIVNNGTYIGSSDGGDWVQFNNINLGSGYNTLRVRYAKGAGSTAGNSIQVRLGSVTGAVVCTFTPASTGDWGVYAEATTSCSGASGSQTLYFVTDSGAGVANIDWFQFEGLVGGPTPTNTPVPPTATKTNTLLPPTATLTNTPVPPTATKTNTPIPPTATKTNTPVGPTATKTNTPMPPTATSTSVVSTILKLEAETYNGMSGITNQGTYIGSADAGDYLYFTNINLGSGYTTLRVNYARDWTNTGTLEIRLDSPTGPVVGTLTTPNTGGWTTFAQATTTLSGASGVHSLYFVMQAGTSNGQGIGNFDWFQFEGLVGGPTPTNTPVLPTATQTNTPLPPTVTPTQGSGIQIEAESHGSYNGYFTYGTSPASVQNIDNNEWLQYTNVTLTSYSTFKVRVASGGTGGTIIIRINHPDTGTTIGTCTISNTGGWTTWVDQTCNLSGYTNGTYTIYIRATSGTNIGYFDYYRFE